MTSDERLISRVAKVARIQPPPPRQVTLSGARLTWVEPQDTRYVTHYNVYVGSEAGNPAYRVPVGATSCVLAGGDTNFWVSSSNQATGTESTKVYVSGTAAGAGSGNTLGLVTGLSATVESGSDTELLISISGTLPTDPYFSGVAFITEVPVASDPHPDTPTMPGRILVEAQEWYATGDGSSFTISFSLPKPDRDEKWVIYALSFGAGVSNALKRLTQLSPPLPVDATPYVELDLSELLTLPGSGLGDVTITGTPTLTPTGYGTLKIDLLYIPPYVSGPAISIGDFQGVTAFVELEDGSVKSYGDFPYLANPAATPPDNLGSVSLSIPMPEAQTIYVQLCSYSTTARLPYKPHATAPSSRWVAIVINSTTISGGSATQVSAFDVTVESATVEGVAAGGKQGRFLVTYTAPVDTKWKEVWIERIACDSSYTPLAGATWGKLGSSVGGKEYYGWWPWPTTTEYWTFRARSVNFDDIANSISYPQEFISLSAEGTFTLANDAVASAMLQDLAVVARAMADGAVGRPGVFTPFVVENAAIGIGAIHNANIYELSVDKLTIPASGSFTLSAGGAFTVEGDGAALVISSAGVASTSGASFGGTMGVGALTVGLLAGRIDGDGSAYFDSLSLVTALSVGNGGTGATSAGDARDNLGLGGAATLDVGTGAGNVAAGDHTHDFSLTYAPLSHEHSWDDITSGTQPAPPSHTHYLGDISDWPASATGTYSNPTSITVQSGIITSIS